MSKILVPYKLRVKLFFYEDKQNFAYLTEKIGENHLFYSIIRTGDILVAFFYRRQMQIQTFSEHEIKKIDFCVCVCVRWINR